jgi:hypothetical protein
MYFSGTIILLIYDFSIYYAGLAKYIACESTSVQKSYKQEKFPVISPESISLALCGEAIFCMDGLSAGAAVKWVGEGVTSPGAWG